MKTRSSRAALRKRAGLTQHRLSKMTGIPSATISLWENHEIDLGAKEVERFARAIAEEMNHTPVLSAPDDLVRMLAPANLVGKAGRRCQEIQSQEHHLPHESTT